LADIELIMGLVLIFNFALLKLRSGQSIHHFLCPCGNDIYFNEPGTFLCEDCGAEITVVKKGLGGQIRVRLSDGDKMFKCPCSRLHFVKHGMDTMISCACGNIWHARNCSDLVVSPVRLAYNQRHGNLSPKCIVMRGSLHIKSGGKP
jgi:hypothetical protein